MKQEEGKKSPKRLGKAHIKKTFAQVVDRCIFTPCGQSDSLEMSWIRTCVLSAYA